MSHGLSTTGCDQRFSTLNLVKAMTLIQNGHIKDSLLELDKQLYPLGGGVFGGVIALTNYYTDQEVMNRLGIDLKAIPSSAISDGEYSDSDTSSEDAFDEYRIDTGDFHYRDVTGNMFNRDEVKIVHGDLCVMLNNFQRLRELRQAGLRREFTLAVQNSSKTQIVEPLRKKSDIDLYVPDYKTAKEVLHKIEKTGHGIQVLSQKLGESVTSGKYKHCNLIRLLVHFLSNGKHFGMVFEIVFPMDNKGLPPSDTTVLLNVNGSKWNSVFWPLWCQLNMDIKQKTELLTCLQCPLRPVTMIVLSPGLAVKYYDTKQYLQAHPPIIMSSMEEEKQITKGSESYGPFCAGLQNMFRRLLHIFSRFPPSSGIQFAKTIQVKLCTEGDYWGLQACGHRLCEEQLRSVEDPLYVNIDKNMVSILVICPFCFDRVTLINEMQMLVPGEDVLYGSFMNILTQ